MAAKTTYDAIVIGGGHNGLVNGAYLAKEGLDTLILERRDLVGGAAITEELHPGFQFTTFSYALSLVRPDIIQELDLPSHGFMALPMPHSFAPGIDGDYLLTGPDRHLNHAEVARRSVRDAERLEDYEHLLSMVVQAVKPLFDSAPPNLYSKEPEELARLAELGRHLRDLEPRVLHQMARFLTGSAADILDAYFEDDLLKGLLASSGIIGSAVGPRSQGSGLVLLYHRMGEYDGLFGTWGFHKGGNGGFTQVLARAATAFGAEIVTGAAVARVVTDNGRATGVALDDGTELDAPIVVSALDPRRTFLELVDRRGLPTDLVDAVERMKFTGVASKVNFALDGLPRHPAMGDGDEHFRGFINIAPSIDYLERAFDISKYGWYSPEPYIDGCVQSVIDPDMAPPGKHVMSCFVQYTPYRLRDSDWDAEREHLGNLVQGTLDRYFPGFSELVLHREVVTPLDIERTIGLTEGDIFAGAFLAPQMYFFRPAPGWNQYRTPIEGYYQCGSGTHPGGCVIGGPGKLAASQIVADRQTTL
jgi:phytoene dehydrogenase-like protein